TAQSLKPAGSQPLVRTESQASPTGRQYASLVAYEDAGGQAAPSAPPDPQHSLPLPTKAAGVRVTAEEIDGPEPDAAEDSDAAALARKLDAIPADPGVYLLRDSH